MIVLPDASMIVSPAMAAQRPTLNSAAYDEYLQGRYLEETHAKADEAIVHFERAVQLDPKFARAWAGIANTAVYVRPRGPSMARAEAAARKAIELDSELAAAHAAGQRAVRPDGRAEPRPVRRRHLSAWRTHSASSTPGGPRRRS